MTRPDWLPDDAPDVLAHGDSRNTPLWTKVPVWILAIVSIPALPFSLKFVAHIAEPDIDLGWTFYLLMAGAMWLLIGMVFGAMAILKPRDALWAISSDGVRWEDGSYLPLEMIARVRWPWGVEARSGQIRWIAGSGDAGSTRALLRRLVAEAREPQGGPDR